MVVSNKLHDILPKLSDKLLTFCNTGKEDTVLNRLHIGHSYFTHSFLLKKEEPPVCVTFATLTVKHILIECADLVEVRKKYFEERFLYSLFWNVNSEKILTTWKNLVCSIKYKVFWSKFCVEKYLNCDKESLRFCRNMCDFVCVYVWNNCAVEILWLMLNDSCAE